MQVHLQYQVNENQCTASKIVETSRNNQKAIEEDDCILLQMDCDSFEQYDIHDPNSEEKPSYMPDNLDGTM